jgi:hypothetical protein
MRNPLSTRHSVKIAAAALVAMAAVAADAHADTSNIFSYTKPKVGSFSISPLAMSPDAGGADYYINFTGALTMEAGNTSCFATGVNLPQGATITSMVVYYASGVGANPSAALRRYKLSDGSFKILVNPPMTDNTGNRVVAKANVDPAEAVVNNNQYTYGLGLCFFTTDNVFYGARIGYTYTQAGD